MTTPDWSVRAFDQFCKGRNDDGFRRTVVGLASAWLALLALMALSLGSAYLSLGAGNVVAGLVIAAIKTGIVAWWFMELRRAAAMTRIAIGAGLGTLLLLVALGFVDYATRVAEPARWQAPQQIAPLRGR